MKRDSINRKIEFKDPFAGLPENEEESDIIVNSDDIRTHFPLKYLSMKKSLPAELFCEKQYKGYYLRGQVAEVPSNIYYRAPRAIRAHAVYRIMILALVKGAYQERLKREEGPRSTFGVLFDNTEEEYLRNEEAYDLESKKFWLRWLQWKGVPVEESLEEWVGRKPIVVRISMDEAEIKEGPYLDGSITAGKEAILLNIELYFERSKLVSDFGIGIDPTGRIYPFLADNLKKKRKNGPRTLDDWFNSLYDAVYLNFDYDPLDKRKYIAILENTGNLCHEWMKVEKVTLEYLRMLNKFSQSIPGRTDPLTDFCYTFFDDLMDQLITQKQIARCEFCGDFFIYQRRSPTKKFCTPSKDKKCRMRYNNKIDYQRHLEERKLKAREHQRKKRAEKKEKDRLKAEKKKEDNRIYQKEYRALLKKHGVKK